MFEAVSMPTIDFSLVRSIMETPILDGRKWAKVPDIPADAFIIDLEDSVVPSEKLRARSLAVDYLQRPDYFGDGLLMARPNNLATPWGREDVIAFAEAGVRLMLYPKIQHVEELIEVRELLAAHGAQPLIFPIIETASAVLNIGYLARQPGLGGFFTGIGDLSAETGISLHDDTGRISRALEHARDMVVLAAVAGGGACTDTVYVKDLHDTADARDTILRGRQRGFTSFVAFYPPHVALINEVMAPSGEETQEAVELVARYEEAQEAGDPAFVGDDGRVVMRPDFGRAQRLLDRANRSIPTMKDVL